MINFAFASDNEFSLLLRFTEIFQISWKYKATRNTIIINAHLKAMQETETTTLSTFKLHISIVRKHH